MLCIEKPFSDFKMNKNTCINCFQHHKTPISTVKKIDLSMFENIKNHIRLKAIGIEATFNFEKNRHSYWNDLQARIEHSKIKNCTIVKTVITYPYIKDIVSIEIHELYYSNILYNKIVLPFPFYWHSIKRNEPGDAFVFGEILKMHKFKFANSICFWNKDHASVYRNIKNKQSSFCIPLMKHCKSLFNKDNFDICTKYNLESNIFEAIRPCQEPNKIGFTKRYCAYSDIVVYSRLESDHPPVMDIYMLSILENGPDRILSCSNVLITEYSMNEYKKTFIKFVGETAKQVVRFADNYLKEETVIDSESNQVVEVKVKEQITRQQPFIAYKIASVIYNNDSVPCILEVEIPKDAKVAGDGSRKYRCDRMIPKRCFINDEHKGIRCIKVGQCNARIHNSNFIYYMNQLCTEPNFVEDFNAVCVPGLHYCLTLEGAVQLFANSDFTKLTILEKQSESETDTETDNGNILLPLKQKNPLKQSE